ncbi:MAG: Hsp70 suppressor, GTPase facilitates ribosomal subunit dissociation [Chaenotheca gracillima]|nr:MAG: Hsp70 suppressor, GTPase facilitates ribosomal subunit dissociation [Chaenotheca gracillima]
MSRHKIVRNLDLDDELDDYDGGEDYNEGGGEGAHHSLYILFSREHIELTGSPCIELSEEDAAQMKACTAKVQEALQNELPNVTVKEIQDSLWHYYYDVDKTVSWLQSQHKPQEEKTPKKKSGSSEQASKAAGGASVKKQNVGAVWIPKRTQDLGGYACAAPLSAAEFFKDTPWLNIPCQRQAKILVEPLYPRGGLLGGSSSGTGKVSKLAALAAARKRESEKKAEASSDHNRHTSVSLLEKLRDNTKEPKERAAAQPQDKNRKTAQDGPVSDTDRRRRYPERTKSQTESPISEELPPSRPTEACVPKPPEPRKDDLQAAPSELAQVILGSDSGTSSTGQDPSWGRILSWTDAFGSPGVDSNAFAGPSPDDIVTAAQNSKGTKGKTSAKQPNGDNAADKTASGVASISIEESSRVKSKNLDVLSEYQKSKSKNSANFVVIGHVDHGKSTLMGRLLLDLKVVDSRTLDKFRKEAESIGKSSFALAWVLDQTSEERSRGITMDIAMNQFETEKTNFTILDAPGHRDFIPNMIAGASQADFAVLVIDSSPNAFESGLKGQTKEHALLVRSMGVQRMIVAVNKMDMCDWSEGRFQEIQQQTLAFLTAAGFQKKNIAFVPCSGLSGDNVLRKAPEKASWYAGPTLVESLEDSEPTVRALEKPLRLTINDVFRGGVMNPLSVSGLIEAGSLQVGDGVVSMPSGETAYIKGIELDSESKDWAIAGQIATLHLTDIDPVHLKTGDILCPPSAPIKNITTFNVKILAFDHITPMAVEVHRGGFHTAGQVAQLVATLDKSSGKVVKKKPKIVQPGSVARIQVQMVQPVPLEAPARIVLRAGGDTLGAGLIE